MITKRLFFIPAIVLLTAFFWFVHTSFAWSAQLKFTTEKMDGADRLALVIDNAKKLAGLKVTISYDKELLSFIKATKSTATSSFLHVVNDKNPGKIIMVMASAKGISGEDVVLLYMEFSTTEKGAKEKTKPQLSVTQLQIMDENLKEIEGNHPQFQF